MNDQDGLGLGWPVVVSGRGWALIRIERWAGHTLASERKHAQRIKGMDGLIDLSDVVLLWSFAACKNMADSDSRVSISIFFSCVIGGTIRISTACFDDYCQIYPSSRL